MEFTANVAIDTSSPITEDMLEAVAAIGGAASGHIGQRRITTHFTVTAPDVAAAVAAAVDRLTSVAHTPVTIASVEIMTIAEHDRRLAEPRRAIGGIAEVAELLRVSRQRASQLQDRDDAPAPLERLKSGPIWYMSDWSTFAQGWHRKPGRVPKDAEPGGFEIRGRVPRAAFESRVAASPRGEAAAKARPIRAGRGTGSVMLAAAKKSAADRGQRDTKKR